MDIDWTGVILGLAGILAGGGTVGAVYNAKKSAEVGMDANEIEASKVETSVLETHSKELRELWQEERDRTKEYIIYFQEQLDGVNSKLEATRKRISQLERREVYATRYIEKLKEHIWQRKPPPPPEPDHELDYVSPSES